MLPSILDGLADEAEGVRDAALAAGRTFVDLYAETALALLLPAVEDGILNDNWRIRQSSVELLGQLLFKVRPLVTRAVVCLQCHKSPLVVAVSYAMQGQITCYHAAAYRITCASPLLGVG